MYNLYSKKIIVFAFLLFAGKAAFGQGQNNPFYDYARVLHFGFTLGTNIGDLKYDFSDEWYAQKGISAVHVHQLPGITLGAVSDLHLGEYFDIRFIPSLLLAQRNITFSTVGDTVPVKQIESALVEFPILLKIKSERHNNVRFYAIMGGKFGYDLSSNYKAVLNPINPKIALYPQNYSYEFGAGFDLYYPLFKFSPEIKLSRGLNNVLFHDKTIYTNIFSKFRSNFIMISLYFEG
jgi:hypothetical protein